MKKTLPKTAQLMFGLQGKEITEQERKWLNSPLCAGVILFTRNFENKAQIKEFIQQIRGACSHQILIAVDHEGGRVQRFREGFTQIPSMAKLGECYDQSKESGLSLAFACAQVLAYELAELDVDFSFAPVLDIQTKESEIIGDRAFHKDPYSLSELAAVFYDGLKKVGMAGVGKHFPGHGNVVEDSHLILPKYKHSLEKLTEEDIEPFKCLINKKIEAIMPAHILYEQCDNKLTAGFSDFWLQKILRENLGFNGCIISDDLDMAGAAAYGTMIERLNLAKKHCDLILLCNNADDMKIAFEQFEKEACDKKQARVVQLARKEVNYKEKNYTEAKKLLAKYV